MEDAHSYHFSWWYAVARVAEFYRNLTGQNHTLEICSSYFIPNYFRVLTLCADPAYVLGAPLMWSDCSDLHWWLIHWENPVFFTMSVTSHAPLLQFNTLRLELILSTPSTTRFYSEAQLPVTLRSMVSRAVFLFVESKLVHRPRPIHFQVGESYRIYGIVGLRLPRLVLHD